MEGYLLKEGAGIVKGYKKRYFVIQSSHLVYYRTKGDTEPVGSIGLKNIEVIPNAGHPNGFTIQGSGARTYNLAGQTAEDTQMWTEKLKQVTAEVSSKSPAGDETETLYSTAASGTKVGLNDFEILKVLGRGSFGKVLKVRRKGTDEIYAMKALRKDVVIREKMVANTKAEKSILQTVQHPFIVKLYFAFQTPDRLYLILDLLSGGELFYHLKNDGNFPLERARLYAAEVASALAHLHNQDIVYRDLKPENVVLDKYGHACLTDFGLAKTSVPSKQQTFTFCGTPEYIAPEILKGTGHGKPVDWWALGILLYEMIVGLPPFYSEDVNEMYDFILNKALEFPPEVPADAQDLISKLLVRDQAKRLVDGEQIKNHAFFKPVNWEKLLKREIQPMFVPDLSGDADKYIDDEYLKEQAKLSVYHGNDEGDDDDLQEVDAAFQGFTFQNNA